MNLLWVIFGIVVTGILFAVYMDILNRFDRLENHIRHILSYEEKTWEAGTQIGTSDKPPHERFIQIDEIMSREKSNV